jgi:hypothetical protein
MDILYLACAPYHGEHFGTKFVLVYPNKVPFLHGSMVIIKDYGIFSKNEVFQKYRVYHIKYKKHLFQK